MQTNRWTTAMGATLALAATLLAASCGGGGSTTRDGSATHTTNTTSTTRETPLDVNDVPTGEDEEKTVSTPEPTKTAVNRPRGYFGDGMRYEPDVAHNTENYSRIDDNEFLTADRNPLSTFSIDVDRASYSNVRRFLTNGSKPPQDAVRIEELVNYFTYDYPQPKGGDPFTVTTEVADCPWAPTHKLVQIGLQGRRIPMGDIPASNIVFLIDVSGSMQDANKLPLLKKAFRMLVGELRERDRVSIVVYAGNAGLVLPPTSGAEKRTIMDAIDRLEAGGSTAGGAGIQLAYETARKNLIAGGNNRVILATDGDFNVGVSSDAELVRMIEAKRAGGVYLTVLGFGTGNYKDSRMEQLADKGNGNYAYIDGYAEARKVFVQELGATMFAIAKDVKIQTEFNPANVKAYRLIGYENRMMKAEDFNDDRKDAGEIGAGHSVTALYEIVPADGAVEVSSVDPLKYQTTRMVPNASASNELMTVKLRYKAPRDTVSKLIEMSVKVGGRRLMASASTNLQFAAAVAGWGMLLRDSPFKGTITYDDVLAMATAAKGTDKEGYRAEFITLVEQSKKLAGR